MNRSYRAIAVAVSLLVYLISSVPYLYGYLRQSTAERFTGIVFDVPDTAQYYAWMRAFAQQPLIANPLTPEPGADRFFNLQWWLLGQLAYGTPLGPTWTYQLLRIVSLVAFAAMLALLCDRAIRPWRTIGFTLVMVSSGFGWLLVVTKKLLGEAELRSPLAVQIAEPNTYFSAMAFPHLLVAGAVSLAIFYAFLRACEATGRARIGWQALSAALTLALGFSHGYDLIPVMTIPSLTAAMLLWHGRRDWRRWLRLDLPPVAWGAAWIVAAAAAPALYLVSLTRLDATWRGVLSQYDNAGVFTPAPPQLVILLGLPLLLALPQLRPAAWRTGDTWQLFLRLWMVGGFALLYIPTDFQVKMLTSYQVPLGLLAAQTLGELADSPSLSRLVPRRAFASIALPTLVLASVILTNGYLTAWRLVDLKRAQYPYFLSSGDVAALETIAQVAARGDVVLSSPEIGVFVPVYTDARPFVAHWAQTLEFLPRRDIVARLFSPATSAGEQRGLLKASGARFVLAGPAEAQLGGTTTPIVPDLEWLGGQGTAIYRVVDGGGTSAGGVP